MKLQGYSKLPDNCYIYTWKLCTKK